MDAFIGQSAVDVLIDQAALKVQGWRAMLQPGIGPIRQGTDQTRSA
ncbi:hypothetical protein [Frateuria aurantia]|nr:hypothetical protein [Frateuria aurantia]